MKKKLLLFFAIGFSLLMFSQETEKEKKTQLGVTANIHQSNIYGIHDYSKGRIAPAFGLTLQYRLEKDISDEKEYKYFLQPVLEYSMDGEKAEPPQGSQKFLNNYISLPIFFKYYFTLSETKRDRRYFLMAGPLFGFAVSDKREGNLYFSQDISADKNFKKFNFGVTLGAGYHFDKNLEAFVRFDRGLSKAYGVYTLYNTYNYKLGVGINYFFGK